MNLQFEITDDEVAKLDALTKETGMDSYKTLFNNSLTLLKWAIEETKKGNIVSSVNESSQIFTELHMDCLDYVKEHNEKVEKNDSEKQKVVA